MNAASSQKGCTELRNRPAATEEAEQVQMCGLTIDVSTVNTLTFLIRISLGIKLGAVHRVRQAHRSILVGPAGPKKSAGREQRWRRGGVIVTFNGGRGT